MSDPFIDLNYMFHRTVKTENGKLVINGRLISLQEKVPHNIKWGGGGVQFTGVFNTTEKAVTPLKGRNKKVTLSAPSAEAPTFVLGVKHQKHSSLKTQQSSFSCIT